MSICSQSYSPSPVFLLHRLFIGSHDGILIVLVHLLEDLARLPQMLHVATVAFVKYLSKVKTQAASRIFSKDLSNLFCQPL